MMVLPIGSVEAELRKCQILLFFGLPPLNGRYTFQSGGNMIDLDALLAVLDLG